MKTKYSVNDLFQFKACPECGANGSQIVLIWRGSAKCFECSKCKSVLGEEKYPAVKPTEKK